MICWSLNKMVMSVLTIPCCDPRRVTVGSCTALFIFLRWFLLFLYYLLLLESLIWITVLGLRITSVDSVNSYTGHSCWYCLLCSQFLEKLCFFCACINVEFLYNLVLCFSFDFGQFGWTTFRKSDFWINNWSLRLNWRSNLSVFWGGQLSNGPHQYQGNSNWYWPLPF